MAGEGNVAIWGTPPDSIDDAEDRDKWYELLTRLDIRQPPGGMVTSEEGALAEAAKLGYPVRPGRSAALHCCNLSSCEHCSHAVAARRRHLAEITLVMFCCVPCLPWLCRVR